MAKKSSVNSNADKHCGDFAKARALFETGWLCQFCMKNPFTDAFHMIRRRWHKVRWFRFNVFASCRQCNDEMNKSERRFWEWFVSKYDKGLAEFMESLARGDALFTTSEVREIAKDYRLKAQEIKTHGKVLSPKYVVDRLLIEKHHTDTFSLDKAVGDY